MPSMGWTRTLYKVNFQLQHENLHVDPLLALVHFAQLELALWQLLCTTYSSITLYSNVPSQQAWLYFMIHNERCYDNDLLANVIRSDFRASIVFAFSSLHFSNLAFESSDS
mmetsp:Transcript_578/g.813  ORF Transcript_578/g.813 Transcript_578/m.813 type:complete len:111 (+) Transcript_578:893-1225(+)